MNIEHVIKRIEASKEIGVDVETSGLDWRYNHICGYVLSFGPAPDDTIYIPVRHAGGGNWAGCSVPSSNTGWTGDLHPVERAIIPLLDRQGVTIIGHNLAFDLRFLNRVGLKKFDAGYEDTMINAALLNEWQSSFSLDSCCKIEGVTQKKTGIYEYIAQKFNIPNNRDTMGHFWRLAGNDPEAVEYASGDGVSTWGLRLAQHRGIQEQELKKVWGVECQTIPVLARMMTRGVKIDEEQLHRVKIQVEDLRDTALSKLPKDFNSRAPSQVRKLMEDAGHTDWPLTAPSKTHKNGLPSFPEAWLSKNPVGRDIVAVRKYSNLLNSFVEPMIKTHMWRGRVHPEYNQLRGDEYGTITGRLSSSNPNLQQANKRNEEIGRIHRSIFVPDEGMLWGSADWSQMEPRILAYYTQCKVLIEGYNANPPIDAHRAVAVAANIDRETGKRVNQTLITGGGKGVLVSRYGIPANEVDRIWDQYFEAMPEIKSFQKLAGTRMRNRGFVFSFLGRRARLNDPSKSYVALNRLLQGGNADAIKTKMVEIDAYFRSEGDQVNLLNNVHDALDFQFAPEHKKIYEEALRIMTSFGPSDLIHIAGVPICVDAKIGKSWAEATFGPVKTVV